MESTPNVNYNELTIAEQTIVANATGWNGKEYFDAKSGIKIELVDGDVATYRVLDKGNQIAEEPKAEETPAPVETETTDAPVQSNEPEAETVVPETEPTAPAEETVPSNDTESESQETTDTAPSEPETEVTPAETPATEPATTE